MEVIFVILMWVVMIKLSLIAKKKGWDLWPWVTIIIWFITSLMMSFIGLLFYTDMKWITIILNIYKFVCIAIIAYMAYYPRVINVKAEVVSEDEINFSH